MRTLTQEQNQKLVDENHKLQGQVNVANQVIIENQDNNVIVEVLTNQIKEWSFKLNFNRNFLANNVTIIKLK